MLRVGAHVSVAKGIDLAIDRAVAAGFNCLQIFTQPPRVWKAKEYSPEVIEIFRNKVTKSKIDSVVVHAPYLPNMATPDEQAWPLHIESLARDIRNADALGANYYVVHPGSSKGFGAEFGLNRICAALDIIFKDYKPNLTFLFESTAGSGSVIGAKMSELGALVNYAQTLGAKAGVCLDTAHSFAAGYELGNHLGLQILSDEIKNYFGFENLHVIHCNDSKHSLGSKKDRHEHIGVGQIGLAAFELLMSHAGFRNKCWILETPKEPQGSDIKNRQTLEALFSKTQK